MTDELRADPPRAGRSGTDDLGHWLRQSLDDRVHELAAAAATAGGRALVVGGWLRDALRAHHRGEPPGSSGSRDVDLEISGLATAPLTKVLECFGEVVRVGRAFPILLIRGLAIEVSLPRRKPTHGPLPAVGGDVWADVDPGLGFAEASRGRDLTVNAMAWDPRTGALLDPHGGRADLEAKRLRATDPARFGEDPVRGLRTAQLAARLEMTPDDELLRLCSATELNEVPPERLFEEFRRLLLRAERPSIALQLLADTDLLRFFPELRALEGVAQDPKWHPEGDVWVHTLQVVDQAAKLRAGHEREDLALMFGALCHDLGKPLVTEVFEGRTVSHGHSEAGIEPTESFLARLRASKTLVRAVTALVREHLAPVQLAGELPGAERTRAGPRAYRRLLRRLRADGVELDLLARVARADHLGRATGDALPGPFRAGDLFLERAREVDAESTTHTPIVTGKYLVAHGVELGPEMGRLLARCRAVQDETGWDAPDAILARALEM